MDGSLNPIADAYIKWAQGVGDRISGLLGGDLEPLASAALESIGFDPLTGKFRDVGFGLGGITMAKLPPNRSIPAFRALRVYPEDKRFPGAYPAMVGKDKLSLREQIPLEQWLKSEFVPFGMKPRKGYHAGLLPRAAQFDLKRPELKGKLPPDMVWSDVSMGADLDLSGFLDKSQPPKIYHRGDVPFADPADLPAGGMYLYSNRASDPPWVVSDLVRHNRILTDEEVNDILRNAGLPPAPDRYGGAWTEPRLRDLGLL